MASVPQSTHVPFAANSPVAERTQSTRQCSRTSASLQLCPLGQVTSASALRDAEELLTPNIQYGEEFGTVSPESVHLSLLTTALDSFFDSILVIHPNGQILQTNSQANCLFANTVPETLNPQPQSMRSLWGEPEVCHPLQPLLDEIWRVATALINSQTDFPHQAIILDSEVVCGDEAFRIRVRWMTLMTQHQPCLLVTIEDLQQTVINQVNVDQWRYKLTPREVDVWRLKRQGYSYKAIASTLYVSENTVKKHLKNIQVKRRGIDGVDV